MWSLYTGGCCMYTGTGLIIWKIHPWGTAKSYTCELCQVTLCTEKNSLVDLNLSQRVFTKCQDLLT